MTINDEMPQKIATAFDSLSDLTGVGYIFIAYLGSQETNGINHAVLAEQTVLTGKDVKNIVLLIFNEKPEGVVLVNVERVVTSGLFFGGTIIDVQKNIPVDAIEAFNTCFGIYMGIKVTPLILLGTRVDEGITYFFLVKGKVSYPADERVEAALVTVNSLTKNARYKNILNPDR